jgi:hypothetical protein
MAAKYMPYDLAYKKKQGFPMHGHKFVKVRNGFFKNGWVSESISLNEKNQEFMHSSQNPYLIAKLASAEIFGRIYGLGESIEKVRDHILRHTEMISRIIIGASVFRFIEAASQLT